MGFLGAFSLALIATGMTNQIQINFWKQTWVLIPDTSTDTCFWYHFSPGVLWGILFYAGLSYSTCLAGLGYNYISSFYPAEASKAAIRAVCVSLSCQLGGMPLWQGLWTDSVIEALTDQPALNKGHLIIWRIFIVNWDINWKLELDQFKEVEWDFCLNTDTRFAPLTKNQGFCKRSKCEQEKKGWP